MNCLFRLTEHNPWRIMIGSIDGLLDWMTSSSLTDSMTVRQTLQSHIFLPLWDAHCRLYMYVSFLGGSAGGVISNLSENLVGSRVDPKGHLAAPGSLWCLQGAPGRAAVRGGNARGCPRPRGGALAAGGGGGGRREVGAAARARPQSRLRSRSRAQRCPFSTAGTRRPPAPLRIHFVAASEN